MLTVEQKIASLERRFWKKISIQEYCWEWQGATLNNGHGTMRNEHSKNELVHRISYKLHYGEIPEGILVCHKCDNPPCVRPCHLFLGTQKDNLQDMSKKGRASKAAHLSKYHSGKNNPMSKLTSDDIEKIKTMRKNGILLKTIAEEFNISLQNVSKICLGQRWGGGSNS